MQTKFERGAWATSHVRGLLIRRAITIILFSAMVFRSEGAHDYWITTTNGSDSNNGTSSNTPWADYYHINLGGDITLFDGDIVHSGGVWNNTGLPTAFIILKA